MNVDIGGGTSKIAVCDDGEVVDTHRARRRRAPRRLDADGKIARRGSRPALRRRSSALTCSSASKLDARRAAALAGAWPTGCSKRWRRRAERAGSALLRLDPLPHRAPGRGDQFSGGVSEYVYGRESKNFGDLGPLLAAEIRARVEACGRASSARSRASAPPWSARRNTRCRSAAARSSSRRSTRCRCATCR